MLALVAIVTFGGALVGAAFAGFSLVDDLSGRTKGRPSDRWLAIGIGLLSACNGVTAVAYLVS